MDDKTIESARAAEADFVESHPQYRTIAHRMGTQYLGKTLNKVLLWACWELEWVRCGGGEFGGVGCSVVLLNPPRLARPSSYY